MAKPGALGRSGLLRKPTESMRIIITTLIGIMLGFFIGISFPTVSVIKLHLPSSIISYIEDKNSGIATQALLNHAWTSTHENNSMINSNGTLKIYVPSNPKGAERLVPGIIVPQSDFYLRRLWGNPSEDLQIKQKYLVTFTVGYGQKNNIDAAVKQFSENFTIMLFHYDGLTSEWDELEWSKRAIHVSVRKQTKWWYAKRFLHPDIVASYDYIFIWDEDLGVEHFNAEEYIKLVRKHGLEISQPGLEPDKGLTWQMTKRRGDREVHKETEEQPGWCSDPHLPPCAAFVEIMAPVFSRESWRCAWHMIQNDLVHGWGLDFALRRCVEPAHEKIGVVDSQWIVHQVVPSLGNQGKSENGKAPWEGVYVRPAGSYVIDQLELRRITYSPGVEVLKNEECVILVGNFSIPAGLHAAEIAISKHEVVVIAEHDAIVFPMVKHPFVVGFLVAEIPEEKSAKCDDHWDYQKRSLNLPSDGANGLPPCLDTEAWESLRFNDELDRRYGHFTPDKRLRAVMISRSLATAYVMDQKAMLLQQTSWQNNVRMGHLVEQIRGSLSSITALSQMLSTHVKRSEITYDIVEDILVQGHNMKDALQKLQDTVHLTKENIVQFNEDSLQKMRDSLNDYPEFSRHLLSDSPPRKTHHNSQGMNSFLPLDSGKKDLEVPMPPLLLAPLRETTLGRPSCVSEMLKDLVGAAVALARKQQRTLELHELSHPLLVAVDQSALRQALSNLIEGSLLRTRIGGKVEIYAVSAPAGGALIVIDDDGPDMHYMTQMHSLTPYGADLFSAGNVEDNMTWNFVAGLTIAREILEAYGCVVRVISPRKLDGALDAGGTRIELWLPLPLGTMGSGSDESSRQL